MLLLDGISSWLKFKLIFYHQAHDWPELCQKGKRQSPIAVCKETSKCTNIPPLEFYYYGRRYEACVENSGHTVSIKLKDTKRCEIPTVAGANLKDDYVLNNIHFHWQSEHTINGNRYPLEAHLVHFKKKCKTMEGAMNIPDGLVVLAVMFKQGSCYNPNLNDFIASTEKVANKIGKPTPITEGVVIDHFLPKNRRHFYMYEGSLTTPVCNENVKWIIFEEILPIGGDQLHRLTKIISEKGDQLKENARSLQEDNEREVLYASDTLSISSIKEYVKEKLGFGR